MEKRRGEGEKVGEGREKGDWGGRRSSLAGKHGGYKGEGALPYMKERRIIWRSRETSLFFFNLTITHLPLIKGLKLSILSFKKNETSQLRSRSCIQWGGR